MRIILQIAVVSLSCPFNPLSCVSDTLYPDTINEILLNARDEDFRLINSHNPESFVNIAMAAFLYFYPPNPNDDDERCVYLGHFPKSVSSFFRG